VGERPKVFIALPLAEELLAPLAGYETTVHHGPGPVQSEQLAALLRGVDGYLGPASLRVPGEAIDAAEALRVISNFGVGYDNVDLEYARRRGIDVCNTPAVLSAAVAELTIALLLQLSRGLPQAVAAVREGRWVRGGAPLPLGSDLSGKTLAIIGMGRIGCEVAVRAAAFGMRVVYHDIRPDCPVPEGAAEAVTFGEALREADFLSLHTNLTEESRHCIGAPELAAMKPTAYLINTARGQIIDQRALAEALREGRLAGAALDVLQEEPPLPDEPLLSMANVVITPHIGSATRETRAAMGRLAVQNLADCLEGRPCPNIVNAAAGSGS
jgi:lactate dehydrogenase-like 2-hydroxyacid dehydrogenase